MTRSIPVLIAVIRGGSKALTREAEMSDDIETRALAAAQKFQEWHANSEDADTVVHQSAQSDAIDYINAVERLVVDRDALRKALDDRHAADKKAWSAIMRATGKERGIPPNKEVVAYLVAEVERLEKRVKYLEGCKGWANIAADRDSLRAKLERTKEALKSVLHLLKPERGEIDDQLEGLPDSHLFELVWSREHGDGMYPCVTAGQLRRARAVLSELSADAPAQQSQCDQLEPGYSRDGLGRLFYKGVRVAESGVPFSVQPGEPFIIDLPENTTPAQQTQINDELSQPSLNSPLDKSN